jgi:hypothetical protein
MKNVGVSVVNTLLFKVSAQILQILFNPVWPKSRGLWKVAMAEFVGPVA